MARHGGRPALRRGRTIAYGVLAALALAAPAPAAAQAAGGSGPDEHAHEAPPLSSPPHGVAVRRPSEVRGTRCLADCPAEAAGAAHVGSRLRLRGVRLLRTREVVFLGGAGEADDVATRPLRPKRRHRIDVDVPLGAASGPVVVADRDGMRSAAAAPLALRARTVSLVAGGPPTVEVQTQAPRAFFDAESPAEAKYVVHGSHPADVLVELVRHRDGTVVRSWQAQDVPAEVPQTVTWNGTVDGRLQRAGRYSFRVSAVSPDGGQAVSAQAPEENAPDPASFVFLRHVFPVRGPHGYGEFAATFGGGRGHQGHDVFAACGTPLVAARGGRVKFKQYHGAAGHYIVIDGRRTGIDYAYMHLREAALVDEGDRVRTGEPIGYVGDTGRASGCHLHLELWSAPGWYDGGSPFDPLPLLRSWDARS